MRLFIAIELPEAVREHLVKLRDQLRLHLGNASLTRDENLHITLKFLGETDPQMLDRLKESLHLIRTAKPIEIFAHKPECFPNRGGVRIVAAGFGGDLAAMKALHQSIEQRCQHLGFDRETREFIPHVTLARARPTLPAEVRSRVSQIAVPLFPGPSFWVHEIALVKSQLTSEGSVYESVARVDLISERR